MRERTSGRNGRVLETTAYFGRVWLRRYVSGSSQVVQGTELVRGELCMRYRRSSAQCADGSEIKMLTYRRSKVQPAQCLRASRELMRNSESPGGTMVPIYVFLSNMHEPKIKKLEDCNSLLLGRRNGGANHMIYRLCT